MNFKKVLPAVVAAGAFALAGTASAYPMFSINPNPYYNNASTANDVFNADKITGTYHEVITLDPATQTFSFSLIYQVTGFVDTNGAGSLPAVTTGLGFGYNLYATFLGGGTFTTNGTNVTGFTLAPGGDLKFYLDPFTGTMSSFNFSAAGRPATGSIAWTGTGTGDDVLIATGDGIQGAANISYTSNGFNAGSFGQTTSFELEGTAGPAFFVAPNPFYDLSFESGALNNGFTTNGPLTTYIEGSLEVVFLNTVPEPSSLALVGAALFAVGFSLKRRKNAAQD